MVAVIAWHLISQAAGEHLVSSPLATGLQLMTMLQRPTFWLDVAETGVATGYAVVLSALLGWGLGVVLGLSRTVTNVGEPFLVTFYSLPKVTLYPIVLLLFGLGV
jgi:NitT/TauT family transport system permease protein